MVNYRNENVTSVASLILVALILPLGVRIRRVVSLPTDSRQ